MARHILKENRVFIMVMDHFYTLVILSTLDVYASGLPKSDYVFPLTLIKSRISSLISSTSFPCLSYAYIGFIFI